jgi:minor fimbrial subunit
VKYNGTSYPFPTTTETARVIYDSRTDKPWPTVLYLTPVSTAGGGDHRRIVNRGADPASDQQLQ